MYHDDDNYNHPPTVYDQYEPKDLLPIPPFDRQAAVYFAIPFLALGLADALVVVVSLDGVDAPPPPLSLAYFEAAMVVLHFPFALVCAFASDYWRQYSGQRTRLMVAVIPFFVVGLLGTGFQLEKISGVTVAGQTAYRGASSAVLWGASFVWSINLNGLGLTMASHYDQRTMVFAGAAVSRSAGQVVGYLLFAVAMRQEVVSVVTAVVFVVTAIPAVAWLAPSLALSPRPSSVRRRRRRLKYKQCVPHVARTLALVPLLLLVAVAVLYSINPGLLLPTYLVSVAKMDVETIASGEAMRAGARILALPAWAWIAMRWGKLSALRVSLVLSSLASAAPFLAPADPSSAYLGLATIPAVLGDAVIHNTLALSILADVVDYDQMRYSEQSRRAATLYAVFAESRLATLLSSAIVSGLVSLVGFNPDEPLTEVVTDRITVLLVFLMLPPLGAALVSFAFPITRRVSDTIHSSLQLLRAGKATLDPVTGVLVLPRTDATLRIGVLDQWSPSELQAYIKAGVGRLKLIVGAKLALSVLALAACLTCMLTVAGGTLPAVITIFAVASSAAATMVLANAMRLRGSRQLYTYTHDEITRAKLLEPETRELMRPGERLTLDY